MPPEPLPWDRRDFRKHERSGLDPRFAAGNFGGGGPQRWREQNHHPHAPPHPVPYHHQNRHQQQQRWYSDFRSSRPIPPGHCKQGGWHMYSDEPGHVYLPSGSRDGDRNFEDENSRPFGSRSDGRSFRNTREIRGWKAPTWEPTTSPSGGRPTAEVNNRKSVESTQTPQNNNSSKGTVSSHPPKLANPLTRSSSQSLLNEQHHKNGGTADEPTSPSQKVEKENGPVSIDWKPLKWHRSGFSHSSSPKGIGVESTEIVAGVQPKNPTPLQSPSADVGICVSPGGLAPLGDSSSRKKPRLGWGQGLAKFEKKKVEGPEECAIEDGQVVSVSNIETLQSHAVNFIDKSPRVVCLPDCASPATPSSVACSSSTSVEEKESIKSVNINNDATKLSRSPSIVPHAHYNGPIFNLENFEPSSIATLSTLINELLCSYNPNSTDGGYLQSSLLNKLLVLKVDISKAIEVTESEIDSLETELKLLIAESRTSPYPASSSSLPGDCHLKPCEDQEGVEGSLDLDVNNSNNSNEKFLDNGEEVNAFSVEPSTVNSSKVLATGSNMCFDVNDHCSIIWASNKDCANRAMEELYKVLPAKMYQFDISIATGASSLNGNSYLVKEKFIKRKRFLQLKEKVLSLKFKVFRHFWKEGRVLSVRKLRLKAHKKFDLSGHKKNRSIRPRISFFSGTPQTVPADEVIEFVNNLLSRMPFKPCRNTLKMPSLILDKEEMNVSRFTSDNGLIIDPRAVEKERSTINPWTSEETEIFIDNLAAFGKDFKKISYFLEHKTIADCIQFYYKNHKSELFVRAKKKKPDSTKQRKPQSTTYLVASTKRWNRETNAASLDILGAASAIVANVNDNGTEILKKCTSKFFFSPSTYYKSSKDEDSERETVAADVLAGICGSISSEAMSSCITSSVDHGDGYYQDWRYQRVGSSKKRALTPDVTQRSIDHDCSDESCDEMGPTDWTDEEKSAFVQAVSSYGKDFVMISQFVGTKSREHCKVYFSKARKSLGLDLIQPESGDVNGGGSDIEDACDAETGSIICKEGTDNSNPEFKICEENNRPRENDSMAAERIIKDLPLCHSMRGDKVVEDLNMEDKEQNDVKFSYEAKKGDSGGVSEGSGREESEGRLILSPNENLNGEKVEDVNSSEASAVSCTLNEMKSDDPCVSHPSIAANSVIQIGKVSECQKKTDLGSEKSPVVPLQENDQLPSVNSSTLFSVPIKYQRSPSHNALSSSGNNMICYKRSNNTVRANDHQKNLSGYAVSDPAEIFSGYPVSVQSKKQINGDLNCKRSIPLQSVPKRNGILHSDRFSLQKCSSSDHLRPQSSGSSDVDQPHRNGDVKLFGKILTSSHPKPNCSEEQDGQLCKPGCQSLNVKFNGDHKVNSNSAQSKYDCSNYSGSENVPVNNCGFWDGSWIQTGFSQLPDSALLLTKYPAAFGNYAMHALNLDQPSIPSNSNGVTEYQVLRNQQTDVLFSEMQRRIGFDVISGIQQQARGINVVGGRGVIASGVSDPVAAIKMHYEQFSLQCGNILKEDDSRRSNGDLGR